MQIQFEMCERFYPLGGRRVEKKLIDFATFCNNISDLGRTGWPWGNCTRHCRARNSQRRGDPRLAKAEQPCSQTCSTPDQSRFTPFGCIRTEFWDRNTLCKHLTNYLRQCIQKLAVDHSRWLFITKREHRFCLGVPELRQPPLTDGSHESKLSNTNS